MESENFKYINFNKRGFKRKIIYFFVIFLILFLLYFIIWFFGALRPVSNKSDVRQIEIKSGESFQQISSGLESAGIIRSRAAFKLLSLVSGSAYKLKPGLYFLESAWSTPNILREIIAGPELEREVLIPPGFTLLDIDRRLSEAGVLPLGALAKFDPETIKNNYDFLKELKSPIKLEGYLFPDTYIFFIKSAPEDVVKKFLDNFSAKAWPALQTRNLKFTADNILTIASLIEKEVYFDKDRPIVAGIIYKRLALGMPLQIDATITYAKCKGFIFYCENPAILKTETKLASLYNTYLHRDLPPGPIGNPGLKSIIAALNPESSDYLYYLSDLKTHTIIFSKTLEEQNENRATYLGL